MTTKVKIMEEALALRIKVRRDGLTLGSVKPIMKKVD